MSKHESQHNAVYMLIALIVVLVGVPAAIDLHLLSRTVIEGVGISLLLAIGIWSLKGSGLALHIAMANAALAIVLNVAQMVAPRAFFYVGGHVTTLIFLLFATVESFRKVVSPLTISRYRIVGAINVYLLVGVLWSLMYRLVEFAVPGSFHGLAEPVTSPQNSDWVYFSFSTLTTLGYGDIVPVTFLSRALAYMESVVGQLYLAILVAGLVSAHIADKSHARH